MELTTDVKKIIVSEQKQFCPYKGDMDWQIECIFERCMKYDNKLGICTRQ
jgi:hypothetical protein